MRLVAKWRYKPESLPHLSDVFQICLLCFECVLNELKMKYDSLNHAAEKLCSRRRTEIRRFRAEMKSLFFFLLLAVGCGVAVGLTREYIYNTTTVKWSEAQAYCRRNFKDLATVTSMEENNRVLQTGLPYSGSWIGLRRELGTWTWSDGENVSFRNWKAGSLIWLDCVFLSGTYEGSWLSDYCIDTRGFYCYRFLILVKESKTWEEALDHCRTYYTGLASVTSESSLRQLNLETVQTQTESVWTGLRFINGQWLWVSGEQLGSLVSMPSCPAPAYRCGALNTTTNTLMNRNCNERLNFVCYWT
ncbi:macrophage mannose receptor 1 [Ictalurus punctatus]|uniref:Macrophage mannose receptor 1 n=1 Tax=Ictalurus punctatus TaxID=7998 RepID=A0A979EPB8_ICTPU|nr:macrophage mannose receptor 1 [Ictalurus punctatus]